MRILFLGDVFGRNARTTLASELKGIREELELDFVIVNGENATQGKGITPNHADFLLNAGIDCMTLGDHAFDQRNLMSVLDSYPNILRPLNLGRGLPGRGHGVFKTEKGKKVLVITALGQVFMRQPFDNPIRFVNEVLEKYPLSKAVDAIAIDFHCEATSEKMIAGKLWDGKVSMVAGTHTHIPTSDARVLPGGTGYITDVGMCGDYESIIGMDTTVPMERFSAGFSKGKMIPANNDITLCGVVVETDDKTGLAVSIEQFLRGGLLGKSIDS